MINDKLKTNAIFLNGTSSSGNSSIAKALQEIIEPPCIHWRIDDYLSAYPKGLWAKKEIVQPEWPKIIQGFHAAGAAIARVGNLVIIDDVLESEPPWEENLLKLFNGLSVLFVGVHCPLVELERREKERKDGKARVQFNQVHSIAVYDVEVDTSVLSPLECAAIIIEQLRSEPRPLAFDQLREKYLRDFE
ncbi:chloramphenicol phosphotransferase CPT family protein [Chloroflexota bacterium]